jgi:cytochrome c nitrite reductase small subunit
VPHDLAGKLMTKASNGYHHSEGFTFQNFHEPIQIKPASSRVLNANCVYCHQAYVREITAHRVAGEDAFNCVRCHDSVGHGPRR